MGLVNEVKAPKAWGRTVYGKKGYDHKLKPIQFGCPIISSYKVFNVVCLCMTSTEIPEMFAFIYFCERKTNEVVCHYACIKNMHFIFVPGHRR